MMLRPPPSTLFPPTTLFRSRDPRPSKGTPRRRQTGERPRPRARPSARPRTWRHAAQPGPRAANRQASQTAVAMMAMTVAMAAATADTLAMAAAAKERDRLQARAPAAAAQAGSAANHGNRCGSAHPCPSSGRQWCRMLRAGRPPERDRDPHGQRGTK